MLNPSILNLKPSNSIILLMQLFMATVFVAACVYIILMVTCLFLWFFSKSRVIPVKQVKVPRIKLTAAVLAVRCSVVLESEFKFGLCVCETFVLHR